MNPRFTSGLVAALVAAAFFTNLASGQTLVWSDEFDGPAVDQSTWTFNTGGSGFGNGELQYYTARPENVHIENGNLVIEARRENYLGDKAFTSSRLVSNGRFAFKYGTVEARIKLPNVEYGLWPALWIMGTNFGAINWPAAGEVDIMEFGRRDGYLAGVVNRRALTAAHWELNDAHVYQDGFIDWPTPLFNDYHLFKMEWTPAHIRMFVDNVQYWSLDISDPVGDDLEEFHAPMFLLTNVAVGGWNFIEITDPGQITATFPARMYIDYIRLYDNGDTELFYGEDAQESGNFGIFTDTAPVNGELHYGTDAELYLWNNLTEVAGQPYEGANVWNMTAAAGTWWGMGVLSTQFDRNMKNYSDGYMHLHMKTTSQETFKIGLKSATSGESWVNLTAADNSYGFVRDGAWHEVVIPLNAFLNLDFQTASQMFMIAGDPPAAPVTFSIDNIYWTPDVARPTPENGNFGIFTEDPAHKTAGEYQLGVDGNFYIWERTLVDRPQTPYEGTTSLSLQSAPGLTWFGAAFTPTIKYNLSAFRFPESKLHFALKTSSTVAFRIGMRSGNVNDIGQKWIPFTSGSDPYGFVRDGNWHVVEIPMSDFTDSVDLTEVSMMFELLGVSGPISGIEIDDVCLLNGGEALAAGAGYPDADAGPDQLLILPTNSAILDGSQSTDNSTITAYHWEQVSGPSTATLINANNAVAGAANLVMGTYVFRLTVTDDEDLTNSDTVSIQVATPEPTANAGPDQSVTIPPDSATLSGSGSDADGTIVAYQWTQLSGPATATIVDPASATTDVEDLYVGTYLFELVVTDNDNLTGSDEVTITVSNPPQNIALGKPTNTSSSTGAVLSANGGFEFGSGAAADGWMQLEYPGNGATASVTRDNATPHSGAWNLRMNVAGAAGGGSAAVAQQVTPNGSIVPGNTYSLTAQARRIGAVGPGAVVQLNLQWLNAAGGVVGSTGFLDIGGSVTEQYAEVGFMNVVAPANANKAMIMLRLAAGAFAGSEATIAFDDVALTTAGGAQDGDKAVDGDVNTFWASEAGDPQWIEVALGDRYEINQVVLDWAAAYAQEYDIDVSDDGVNWTTVHTTTSGAGGVETINRFAVGRYIRLYAQTGATAAGCSLYEFEVYGQIQPGDIDGDGNVNLTDFAQFLSCLTGPGIQALSGCYDADLNRNTEVDLLDFAKLQAAFGNGQ